LFPPPYLKRLQEKNLLLRSLKKFLLKKKDDDMEPIPDLVEPIVGYRTWDTLLNNSNQVPKPLLGFDSIQWPIGKPLEALCLDSFVSPYRTNPQFPYILPDCVKSPSPPSAEHAYGYGCGIYAYRNLENLPISLGIMGEVYLWGNVYEHEFGWRAQYGQPKCIYDLNELDLGGLKPRFNLELVAEFNEIPLVSIKDETKSRLIEFLKKTQSSSNIKPTINPNGFVLFSLRT
jgi:hypothetical protein